ncbi:SRPBCC family protein [Actinomadura napierensis]|uniref:SRPBCC family protein n=1 Tax=Actinomadura napierensis TaxID=267854 RepID=A0ABN3A2N3_9ACTN
MPRAYASAVLNATADEVWAYLRVAPVTGTGQALVEWWGEFSADPGDEEAMDKTLSHGIYATGLDALARRFA